jgi:hypothetical protein
VHGERKLRRGVGARPRDLSFRIRTPAAHDVARPVPNPSELKRRLNRQGRPSVIRCAVLELRPVLCTARRDNACQPAGDNQQPARPAMRQRPPRKRPLGGVRQRCPSSCWHIGSHAGSGGDLLLQRAMSSRHSTRVDAECADRSGNQCRKE